MLAVVDRIPQAAACICIFIAALSGYCLETYSDRLADTVYVAGRDDMAPLEYLEDGEYAGEIPGLLRKIEAETGMSFVYLPYQEGVSQEERAGNLQAELLSCLAVNEEDKAELAESGTELSKALYIIRYDDRPDTEVCFGFTPLFNAEDRERFTAALERLTAAEPVILTGEEQESDEDMMPVSVVVFGLIGAGLFIIAASKKKKGTEEDEPAGIEELYESLYNSDAVRDALKYIAVFETENSRERIRRILYRSRSGAVSAVLPDSGIVMLFSAISIELALKTLRDTAEELEAAAAAAVPVKDAGLDPVQLVNCARQACSAAEDSTDRVYICTGASLDRIRRRIVLAGQLHDALQNDQFELYLQPIVRTADGCPVCAEALSRWDHPRLGFLTPVSFIQLVKELDMEAEFDRIQLRRVCSELAEWKKAGRTDLYIHCNVSKRTLSEPDFPEYLESLICEYDIPECMLMTEVTEEAYDSVEQVLNNIVKLRERGFSFALDDYGTGDTGEWQIKSGLFKCIKIDVSLLRNAVSTEGEKQLKHVIDDIHDAGSKAVCEGIENADQAGLLKELGCELSQGYFYYRPMPEQIAAKILMDGKI